MPQWVTTGFPGSLLPSSLTPSSLSPRLDFFIGTLAEFLVSGLNGASWGPLWGQNWSPRFGADPGPRELPSGVQALPLVGWGEGGSTEGWVRGRVW